MAPSLVVPLAEQSKPTCKFPSNASSSEYAESLDVADPLKSFRDQFIIPSKANLKTTRLAKPGQFNMYPDGKNSGF
jgi:kynureninase